MRNEILGIFDKLYLILGLIVISSASRARIQYGVKTIILIATLFASLAFLQWTFMLADPSLADFTRAGPNQDEVYTKDFTHPISWLGSVPEGETIFLGHTLVRLSSYASEPSLLPLYFLIPASFALMSETLAWRLCAIPIITTSLVSLSGSVYLSLTFSIFAWLSSQLFGIRRTIRYAPIPLLLFLVYTVMTKGFAQFDEIFAYLSTYANFLERSKVFALRTSTGISAFNLALASPFGSLTRVYGEIPFALLVNVVINAGWLGLFYLLTFVLKFSTYAGEVYESRKTPRMNKIGCMLYAGVFLMILLFNDYQATTYPGIMLLMFAYRIMELRAYSRPRHKVLLSSAVLAGAMPA